MPRAICHRLNPSISHYAARVTRSFGPGEQRHEDAHATTESNDLVSAQGCRQKRFRA